MGLTEDYFSSSRFSLVSQKTICYRFAICKHMFGGYIDDNVSDETTTMTSATLDLGKEVTNSDIIDL
jgi:hypothetical protein